MPIWILWGVFLTFAGVAYQTTSKSVASQMPIFLIAAIVGFMCFTLSSFVLVFQKFSFSSLKDVGISSALKVLVLGLFAWSIEFGYLMLYKSDAPLSLSRIMIMAATGILLLVIGVLFFREDVSKFQIFGACLVLGGLALLTIK